MIMDDEHDMVLCDELNIVLRYDYLPVEEIVEVLKKQAGNETRDHHRAQRQGRTDGFRRSCDRNDDDKTPVPRWCESAGRH